MNLCSLVFGLLGVEVKSRWFATECLEAGDMKEKIGKAGLRLRYLGQVDKLDGYFNLLGRCYKNERHQA